MDLPYGFAKNSRENIDAREIEALKEYARVLMSYDESDLQEAMNGGRLTAVQRSSNL